MFYDLIDINKTVLTVLTFCVHINKTVLTVLTFCVHINKTVLTVLTFCVDTKNYFYHIGHSSSSNSMLVKKS